MRTPLLAAVAAMCGGGVLYAPAAQDVVRFLHFSDSHLPRPESERAIAAALRRAATDPFDLVVHTGDVTEFGGRSDAWPLWSRLCDGVDRPVLTVLGNHDLTWDGLFDRVAGAEGVPYRGNDHAGIHFVALCSGSYQDPRPSFGEDQLAWLERHLGGLENDPLLIVLLHHPPGGREFAGQYKLRRLHSILQEHHVVALLVGHGHGVRTGRFGNWTWIMGGSTFGENAGYGECEVTCTSLDYTYHFTDADTPPRRLPEIGFETPDAPELTVERPADGAVVRDGKLEIRGRVLNRDGGLTLRIFVDEVEEPHASLEPGSRWSAKLDVGDLAQGAHVFAVEASDARGQTSWALRRFRVDRGEGPIELRWRRRFDTAFTGRPALAGDRVAVCGKDGRVLVLDAGSGATVAEHDCGSVIVGGAAVLQDGRFAFGTGAGELRVIDRDGACFVLRTFDAPVVAMPLVGDDGTLYAADLSGAMAAVRVSGDVGAKADADANGELLWRRRVAGWAIEKAPVALPGGRLAVGAWDERIHCVSVADGATMWSLRARGARDVAPRYYSPADCSPALAAGRLFVADRKFWLTVTDLEGRELDDGARLAGFDDVAAVSASPAGDAVYLRGTRGTLRRLDPRTLEVVWTLDVPLGRTPTPPAATDEHVWVQGENDGQVYFVDAASGALRATWRVQQAVYPFAPLCVDGDRVFAASLDGSVTALALRR